MIENINLNEYEEDLLERIARNAGKMADDIASDIDVITAEINDREERGNKNTNTIGELIRNDIDKLSGGNQTKVIHFVTDLKKEQAQSGSGAEKN